MPYDIVHSDPDDDRLYVIHITTDDPDDLTVWGDYDPRTLDYVKLTGDDRRAALERVAAVIDAELDAIRDRPAPAGQLPGDGPVPDSGELAALRDAYVDALAKYWTCPVRVVERAAERLVDALDAAGDRRT